MKQTIVAAVLLVVMGGLAVGSLFASSFTNYDSSMITLVGTLEAGVEAGCMLLHADNGTEYLLLGWSNYPPAGNRIAVTGHIDDNVVSYCMQGNAAIRVASISVLNPTTSRSVSYGTASATAGTATIITDSTARSTTIVEERVTVSGYVYEAVETPQCRPQCGAPSFILTYLYVPAGAGCTGSMGCFPPPRYYKLVNIDGSVFQTTAPNGTYSTVTGKVVTPSSWDCESFYIPKICMTGDIYVQSIAYVTSSQSVSTLSSATTENEARGVPISGFGSSSILLGLLVGLTILALRRRRLPTSRC